jgi:hypothetical protein
VLEHLYAGNALLEFVRISRRTSAPAAFERRTPAHEEVALPKPSVSGNQIREHNAQKRFIARFVD